MANLPCKDCGGETNHFFDCPSVLYDKLERLHRELAEARERLAQYEAVVEGLPELLEVDPYCWLMFDPNGCTIVANREYSLDMVEDSYSGDTMPEAISKARRAIGDED